MSAADCTKDCTVDCGTCKGDPIGTLKRHIMRQLGFSRGAHGGIPFDRKDVWDYGYLEAKRAVMRVLYPRPGTVDGAPSQTSASVDALPDALLSDDPAQSAATDAGRAADAPGPYPSSALPSDGA